MADKPNNRITQTMTRPAPAALSPAEGLWAIVRMIENGEEPRRLYSAIAEASAATGGVAASALFLPYERGSSQQEMVASYGDFAPETARSAAPEKSHAALQSMATSYHRCTSGVYNYFDVVCLGAPIGSLVVCAPTGLSHQACEKLGMLAHLSGVVFERQRLSNTLQHFLDRLQILNELNQLIASNVGLENRKDPGARKRLPLCRRHLPGISAG